MTISTLDLEHQLRASLALFELGKAEGAKVAATPQAERPLLLMPKPTPGGSEIPPRLSPSSLNAFTQCQAKWYARKVLRLPETRGGALGLGTAVHAALIENFRQKIETREDLDTDGVRALFIGAFTEQLDEIKLQPDESADDLKEAGEVMVRVYMDRAAPAVEPAALEEHVEGFIGDVPVHGYIDIRDVDGRIIDVKTAKRKPAGTMQEYRTQVATYAMLHPEASGLAQLSTLTKTKTVELHQDSIEIKPRDRRLTEQLYSIARDQMAAGIYLPNRASHLCSRRYCSHWQWCEDSFGGEVSA